MAPVSFDGLGSGGAVAAGKLYYAHTRAGQPPEYWELLDRHLGEVAVLAAQYAEAFGARVWGGLAGAWHDLGKRSAAFQDYLTRSNDPDAAEEYDGPSRVDHSTFGARHAAQSMPGLAGKMLAFCIAGHHGGLADGAAADEEQRRATLAHRLDELAYEIPPVVLPDATPPAALTIPFAPPANATEVGFALAFFTRMVFSALIDADRSATEAFCDPPTASERNRPKPTPDDLRPALDAHLAKKQADAPPTRVNQTRARVLAACLAKSALPPGFFSLDVPTGGGKTFASLAFALHHAGHHRDRGMRRVVVAIPFTSIIEQTADEYRKALGPLAELGLVEHHSNIEPRRQTRANALAAENWDAPLIVTTNVQLYESLFAARTTPCRKLHRLAGSVIVLDEAQTMPVDLLAPTLVALRELVARYGCSVVLCTATQPALSHRPGEFEVGLKVQPIIDDAPRLHAELKRVEVTRMGVLGDDELAARLAGERSALCVVNTRTHAANLFELVAGQTGSEPGNYHLSNFMCAQHRRDVLAVIRQRLRDGLPCRVVSTQLIEAGVDVDFPVVYRAPAGFDSVAQAAGRCNREGRLTAPDGNPVPGKVFLFDTVAPPPPGMLRQTAETARELAGLHPDPLTPAAVEAYFRLYYWSRKHEWDKHGVLGCFGYPDPKAVPPFMFRRAAEAYQVIREVQFPVVVPYTDEGTALRDALLAGRPVDYRFQRDAQRFIVPVREPLLQRLADQRAVVPHESGLWAWANDPGYSRRTGLSPETCGLDPMLLTF